MSMLTPGERQRRADTIVRELGVYAAQSAVLSARVANAAARRDELELLDVVGQLVELHELVAGAYRRLLVLGPPVAEAPCRD